MTERMFTHTDKPMSYDDIIKEYCRQNRLFPEHGHEAFLAAQNALACLSRLPSERKHAYLAGLLIIAYDRGDLLRGLGGIND